MLSSAQQKILKALRKLFRPVVRMALHAGIGYREVAEVLKAAFVEVSTSDYGIRGRPTNISRVAVMTGLTRKEVKRIRDEVSKEGMNLAYRAVPAADVLHFWHVDPDFLDVDGKPIKLKVSGPRPSFADLVRRYGGDVPVGAMKTELQRIDALEIAEDGSLTAKKRSFSAGTSDETIAEGFENSLSVLAETISHNIAAHENGTPTWIQRTVYSEGVRAIDAPRIRRMSRDRLIEFSESMDDFLSAYEQMDGRKAPDQELVTIGIGLYYFEQL